MNYVYSGKDYSRAVSLLNYDDEFIKHVKISPKDLLYSYWDATPYKPGYCVTVDRDKKNIVVCLRGSNNWADVLTDLDANSLSFNIMS